MKVTTASASAAHTYLTLHGKTRKARQATEAGNTKAPGNILDDSGKLPLRILEAANLDAGDDRGPDGGIAKGADGPDEGGEGVLDTIDLGLDKGLGFGSQVGAGDENGGLELGDDTLCHCEAVSEIVNLLLTEVLGLTGHAAGGARGLLGDLLGRRLQGSENGLVVCFDGRLDLSCDLSVVPNAGQRLV